MKKCSVSGSGTDPCAQVLALWGFWKQNLWLWFSSALEKRLLDCNSNFTRAEVPGKLYTIGVKDLFRRLHYHKMLGRTCTGQGQLLPMQPFFILLAFYFSTISPWPTGSIFSSSPSRSIFSSSPSHLPSPSMNHFLSNHLTTHPSETLNFPLPTEPQVKRTGTINGQEAPQPSSASAQQ